MAVACHREGWMSSTILRRNCYLPPAWLCHYTASSIHEILAGSNRRIPKENHEMKIPKGMIIAGSMGVVFFAIVCFLIGKTNSRSDKIAIYRTYVQTAENTSTRSRQVNQYMVPLHSAIFVAQFAFHAEISALFHLGIAILGTVTGVLWVAQLIFDGEVNKVKHGIIRDMESDLRYQPFTEEEKRADSGDLQGIASFLQASVPKVVCLAHSLMGGIYLNTLINS